MIQSKDCKELLYNMLNDNILSITELSKTSDHQPSRTFYLFTMYYTVTCNVVIFYLFTIFIFSDMYQLCKKILGYTYKVF